MFGRLGRGQVGNSCPVDLIYHKPFTHARRTAWFRALGPAESSRSCANGADGISDIEGKVTRVGASERGQRTSFNGADGISDIEGKVARVATSKLGNERVSNFFIRRFNDLTFYLSRRSFNEGGTDHAAIARARARLGTAARCHSTDRPFHLRRRQRPLPGYGVSRSRVWGAHASRVLVSAPRRNEL